MNDITTPEPGTAVIVPGGEVALVKRRLYAHVLLDSSGSMATIADDAVGGYNAFCRQMRDDAEVDAEISLTVFGGTEIALRRDRALPASAELVPGEYRPAGGTPLLDAIGATVNKARERVEAQASHGSPVERVVFVIITDGAENASREWTRDAVKALINERQAAGWMFLYLGANVDAFSEAGGIGIAATHASGFAHTAGGTRSSFHAAAASAGRYGRAASGVTGQSMGGFLDEERADMEKGDRK